MKQNSKIRFLGINREVSNTSAFDGTCSEIINLAPEGNPQNFRWRANKFDQNQKSGNGLLNKSTDPDSANDLTPIAGHIHYNRIQGKDQLLLFYKAENSPTVFKLSRFEVSSNRWAHQETLLELPSPSTGEYTANFVDTKDGVYVNVVCNDFVKNNPSGSSVLSRLYEYKDDIEYLVPVVFPLLRNDFIISTTTNTSVTKESYEINYPDANQPGFITNKDKYVAIVIVATTLNGKRVRHTSPVVIGKAKDTDDTNIKWWNIQVQTSITSGTNIFNMDYSDDTKYFFDHYFEGLTTGTGSVYAGNTATVNDKDVTNAIKEKVGGLQVFMTLPRSAEKEAFEDGVYYYAGNLELNTSGPTLLFTGNFNEEELATREILNPDELSHFGFSGNYVSDFRGRISVAGIYNHYPYPGMEIPKKESGAAYQDAMFLVTVKTPNKEFKKVSFRSDYFVKTGSDVTIDKYISYPSRDATKMEVYVQKSTGTTFVLSKTFTLKPHPSLNLSYAFDDLDETVDSDVGTAVAKSSIENENDEDLIYEPDEFKVSDVLLGYFPLLQSYKVGKGQTILGLVDNTDTISEGQFGSHPLYILTDKGVFSAQYGSNSLFESINPVTFEYGIANSNCFTIKNSVLYLVTSTKEIVALQGNRVDTIDFPIRDLVNDDIFTGSPSAVGKLNGEDKIYFSITPYDIVFDTRYSAWYLVQRQGLSIETHQFFEYKGITYSLAYTDEFDDSISLFDTRIKSGAPIVPDDRTSISGIKLYTNLMSINDETLMKRLFTSVLKGFFDHVSATISIKLKGRKNSHSSDFDLIRHELTSDEKNVYLRSNYGSCQMFLLEIISSSVGPEFYIEELDIVYQNRGENLKK